MKMHGNEAVLLAANYSNRTGYAWSNIYRLYNSIARSLFERHLDICISFAALDNSIEIIDEDIPYSVFVFDPLNITLRSLLSLKNQIKKHNIRYVYFTDMPTWHWLYAILRNYGIKKIVVHCRISVRNPKSPLPEEGIKQYLKTALNNMPLLRADSIYAISDFVRDRLIYKNCYPKERVIKIPNGIDTKKFSCLPKTVVDDPVIIFCCSRASKHKGILTLIEAANIIKSNYGVDNFLVQYAGDGPDLGEFKLKAKELRIDDKIIFFGQLESTHEYTCNADIIVVPSEWGEGFASTVVEGMAAGKALVATQAGGIPEVVGGDKYGRMVPPGNSQLLAKTLLDLIRDAGARRELGINARSRAQELFDVSLYHKRVAERLLCDFTEAD